MSDKLIVYNSDIALLSSTVKHVFLIDTQLLLGPQSLLFRAADVSHVYGGNIYDDLNSSETVKPITLGRKSTWKGTIAALVGH